MSINWQHSFINIGMDFRYLSRIAEIDNELVDFGIVKNGDRRVDIKVVDAHLAANLFHYSLPLRIFINAYNLLNYNYVEMIGNIAPIRNFSISTELLF